MVDLLIPEAASADLGDLIVPEHSKREIVEAGKLLGGRLPYPYTAETLAAFKVAHDWRLSHLIPMRRVRSELNRLAKPVAANALTAARIKRLWSLRKKLRYTNRGLYDIQDIGGVRAILPNMEAVRQVQALYASGASAYEKGREDDYILEPKGTGYRSAHVVLTFPGDGSPGSKRRRIEVQLRTQLQHAWATAVEAVGLVRNEDLKGGEGSAEWRRLFVLVAAEMAFVEGCPHVPGVAEARGDYLDELRELERRLDAIAHLVSYNQAIARINDFAGERTGSFLVRFDFASRSVRIQSGPRLSATAADLLQAETDQPHPNAVMVEVDRAADLKAAYPNYFLDVHMFVERLQHALSGTPRQAQWGRAWRWGDRLPKRGS